MFDSKVTTNKHGVNVKIHSNILSDDEMSAAGFHHHSNDAWYFSKMIGPNLTFNVTIKDDNSDFMIDVLDDDYLEVYDYQEMLRYNPNHKTANKVLKAVEKWMAYLQDAGILSGHNVGEYI